MKPLLPAAFMLLLASTAAAYPGEEKFLSSRALDSYNKGNFEKAEELYSKALEKSAAKPKPMLKYNIGSSQLKSGKISKALESYQDVYDETNTPLNAAARYNAGVAHHSLARKALEATAGQPGMQAGENAQEMARQTAIRELESALKQYRSALSAMPGDNDMKFNYELAQRELEQLKIQQQQQQQQNKNQDQQDQQKQQQDQQQQQQKDEQQQDQQKKDEQQQPQPQNSDRNRQKPDEQKSGDEQQQEQQKKEQDRKDDKQPQGGQPKDGKGQQEPPPNEMSPEDVERLLNTLPPENQQALQRFFNIPLRSGGNMDKDW